MTTATASSTRRNSERRSHRWESKPLPKSSTPSSTRLIPTVRVPSTTRSCKRRSRRNVRKLRSRRGLSSTRVQFLCTSRSPKSKSERWMSSIQSSFGRPTASRACLNNCYRATVCSLRVEQSFTTSSSQRQTMCRSFRGPMRPSALSALSMTAASRRRRRCSRSLRQRGLRTFMFAAWHSITQSLTRPWLPQSTAS